MNTKQTEPTLKDLTARMHSITLSILLVSVATSLLEDFDTAVLDEALSALRRVSDGSADVATLRTALQPLCDALPCYPIDEEQKRLALESIADFDKIARMTNAQEAQ